MEFHKGECFLTTAKYQNYCNVSTIYAAVTSGVRILKLKKQVIFSFVNKPWIPFCKTLSLSKFKKLKEFFSEQWAKIGCYHIILWKSSVGSMCFQPEASIQTYGALPAAVLSKTYSGAYQYNWHKPEKSAMGMMLLSLLRVQNDIILPKWYKESTRLCFDCPQDGNLHIPCQPSCNHSILFNCILFWVEVPD